MAEKSSGWDSRAIAIIAEDVFGGYLSMFEHYGWPERGSQMMLAAPVHICRQWGSVEKWVGYFKAILV